MIRVWNYHFKFCDYCRWMFLQLVTRPRMSIGPCSRNGNIATFSLHCQVVVCTGSPTGIVQELLERKYFYCIQVFFAVRAGQHKLW